jgi:hypothetical protein
VRCFKSACVYVITRQVRTRRCVTCSAAHRFDHADFVATHFGLTDECMSGGMWSDAHAMVHNVSICSCTSNGSHMAQCRSLERAALVDNSLCQLWCVTSCCVCVKTGLSGLVSRTTFTFNDALSNYRIRFGHVRVHVVQMMVECTARMSVGAQR